jgi:hypothetical protein
MRVTYGFYGAALALAFLAAGCGGGGADAIMKESIAQLNEMATTLETIKDDKTADEAIAKLEKQGTKMQELKKKSEDLKLSKDDEKKLMDKYKDEMEKASKKLQEAMKSAVSKAPTKAMAIAAAVTKAAGM